MAIPFFTLFVGLCGSLGVFILFTLISFQLQILSSIWCYFLLLLESLSIVFIEITVRCFDFDGWGQNDSKYQVSAISMLLVFSLLIYLKSHIYYPFNDNKNPLAMSTGKVTLYTYIYAIIMCLSTNRMLLSDESGAKQLTFFVTIAFFTLTYDPPTSSPSISRVVVMCSISLLWTSGMIWFIPLLEQIIDSGQSASIWYYWCYSMPVILALNFIQSSRFNIGYEWRRLFMDSNKDDLRDLCMQVNQLIKVAAEVKKS